jgi:hypothetical protein
MYLNVRTQSIQIPWPFSAFLPVRPTSPEGSSHPQASRGRPEGVSSGGNRIAPIPPFSDAGVASRRPGTTIPPIPPAANPRGELIFTRHVDKHFRESYERYRAAFERRRDEKVLADAATTTFMGRLTRGLPTFLSSKGTGSRKVSDSEKDVRGAGGDMISKSGTPVSSANPSRSTTPVDAAAARVAAAK